MVIINNIYDFQITLLSNILFSENYIFLTAN